MVKIVDLTEFRKTGTIAYIKGCESGYYVAIKKTDSEYKIDSPRFSMLTGAGRYLDNLLHPLLSHILVYVDKQGYVTEK